MNRGRWGVGVERRRPGSGVATSRGLREATATAGTPGSGSRVRAQISQCLSSQNSHEVWRLVKRVKFVLSSSCCSEKDIITWGTMVCSKIPTCGPECQKLYLSWLERKSSNRSILVMFWLHQQAMPDV